MIGDCAHLQEVAPELALGILVGAERAHALAHLAGCAECRQLVDEMSSAADSLLVLAAEAEAPLGFESRLLSRLTAERPRRRPWRWIAAAAAAVVLAGAATGVAVHHHDAPANDLHVRTASLRTSAGTETGDVYVTGGRPAWVFMSVDSAERGKSYQCELTFSDGRIVRAGQFTVADREGWWGTAVKTGVEDLRSVRLLASDGTTIATAQFD
ncbi:MAG: hypothetical protein QOJ74_420 [Ilumatobacteraceae bacterium]|nr:hypothetical protein [Ilumatobacteraceae bacterium]